MLYLDTLKFNNFGRFTEEQVFEFNKHSNLLLIDGKSGVGKSTIFHALDYLLGINLIPATQLQCRFTKKSAYVEGIFRYNDEVVSVKRCKTTGLTITTPSETISGNVDLAEQKLDELIGVPRKLFKKITHKPQRDFGFFLQMTSKQIYLFLIELLGLKIYQDKVDIISEQVKDKTKIIESSSISLEGLKSSLDELLEFKNNEIAPICTVDKYGLLVQKSQLEQIVNMLLSQKNILKEKLSELVVPIKIDKSYDTSTIYNIEDRIKKLQMDKNLLVHFVVSQRKDVSNQLYSEKNTLNQIAVAKIDAKTIGAKIVELNGEKKQLESKVCCTCKQSWATADTYTYIEFLNVKINALIQDALQKKTLIDQEASTIQSIEELQCRLNTLQEPDTSSIDTQILGFQEQLSQERNKFNNFKKDIESEYLKEYSLFLQKQNELNGIYLPDISKLESQVMNLTLDIRCKEGDLQNFISNQQTHLKKLADIESTIIKKNASIVQQEELLINLRKEIDIAEETKRLIKSYTLQIFQDTLDTIGENASAILGNVHNMADSSIYFESCKETKTGNMKDEVNAIITKEGEQDIPIKTLSGGERTVVDLAVDLAVIDVIESTVGKGANFFIIDEPFDGLDPEGKEQYLEVLKTLNTNKQIILVDHSPELKEMISDVIKIEK